MRLRFHRWLRLLLLPLLGCNLLLFPGEGMALEPDEAEIEKRLDELVYWRLTRSYTEDEVKSRPDLQRKFAEWKEDMDQIPDANNRLVTMWERRIDTGRASEMVTAIGSAIARRKDLAPDLQARIARRLERAAEDRVAKGAEGSDPIVKATISTGLNILRNFPSPEHEKLALRFLADQQHEHVLRAATALGYIGTLDSVEPMRRIVEKRRRDQGIYFDPYLPEIEASLKMLEERVGAPPAPREEQAVDRASTDNSGKPQVGGIAETWRSLRSPYLLLAAAAVICFVTGLFWLMRKRFPGHHWR